MVARAIRWFLIAAPVVAGILVLALGTAGSVSTAFGVVLIGIGPIVWMCSWFIRMSFNEGERPRERRAPQAGGRDPGHRPVRLHPEPLPGHQRRKPSRPPRR